MFFKCIYKIEMNIKSDYCHSSAFGLEVEMAEILKYILPFPKKKYNLEWGRNMTF